MRAKGIKLGPTKSLCGAFLDLKQNKYSLHIKSKNFCRWGWKTYWCFYAAWIPDLKLERMAYHKCIEAWWPTVSEKRKSSSRKVNRKTQLISSMDSCLTCKNIIFFIGWFLVRTWRSHHWVYHAFSIVTRSFLCATHG